MRPATRLTAILIFCFAPSLAFTQDTSFTGTEAHISEQVSSRAIPGVSYAITLGDQVIVSKGLGVKSVETNEPVTPDTLFHIGSTHKSITALIVARLAEQGVLSWRSRIGEILTGTEFYDFAVPKIRMNQLLSMTSGVQDVSDDDFYDEYGDFGTPEEVIEFIKGYELPVLPSKEFSYSNLSASLAGYLAVYAAAGNTTNLNQGYSDLLFHQVLLPLGMSRSTIFVSEARESGDYSVSHVKRNGVSLVSTSEDRDDDMFAPAGSLKSSANDMAKYIMLMARRGLAADGTRLLQPRSVRKLWRPTGVSRASGDDYGLGWERFNFGRKVVMQHEGAFDNFTSIILVVPKREAGLVILANTEYVGKLFDIAEIFLADLKNSKKK